MAMFSQLCRDGLHAGNRNPPTPCQQCDCWCHLKPNEPADIVISTGGYAGNWNAELGELRIPFAGLDSAEEVMTVISMRIEKGQP